jgi:hypothetical protein
MLKDVEPWEVQRIELEKMIPGSYFINFPFFFCGIRYLKRL